jgi:hypothetical protein
MVLKSWRNKEKNSKKKIFLELVLVQSVRHFPKSILEHAS